MERTGPDVIYLDHAATTPIAPRVLAAMQRHLSIAYGNASSPHALGRRARAATDGARAQVAAWLGCARDEVIFTGTASESNNLAIKGIAWASKKPSPHIITSAVEHPSVLECCEALRKCFGCRITVLPVDRHGLVDPDDIRRAITPDTVLVTIMAANNEVGTLNPIAEIGQITAEAGIAFHTDAVAAACFLDPKPLGAKSQMVSVSGHKIQGPQGVGVLKVERQIQLVPLVHGGGQEFGLRSGTENVAQIVGMGEAATMSIERDDQAPARVSALRDRLVEGLLGQIPRAQLTGHPRSRLPNHASFVFAGVEGRLLVDELGQNGVIASSGSACASNKLRPSHVLRAMAIDGDLAESSLRLSLGVDTTQEQIDRAIRVTTDVVAAIRRTTCSGNAGIAVA